MSGSPLLQLVSPDAEICLPGEAVGYGEGMFSALKMEVTSMKV